MPNLRKRHAREASPPKAAVRSHKRKQVTFASSAPIRVPSPCISNSGSVAPIEDADPEVPEVVDSQSASDAAAFSPASTLSPPPALSRSPSPPSTSTAHLTFSSTRPASLKPTSSRKGTGTRNAHPYTKAYLKKHLHLDEPRWTALVATITTALDRNSELLDSASELSERLTEMALLGDVKLEDEDGDGEERPFWLYQVALFARRKAMAKSGREQLKDIRSELSIIRSTTRSEISAIRADTLALQETQAAQGAVQSVLNTRITEVVGNIDATVQAAIASNNVVNNVVLVGLIRNMMGEGSGGIAG